jgi:hypothetical protein
MIIIKNINECYTMVGYLLRRERDKKFIFFVLIFGEEEGKRKRERHTGGNIGHDRRAIEIDKRVMQKKRGKYLINIKCHCYVFLIVFIIIVI